jgi:3-phenylpropionate/trans-cinnamate dioxygenase ferredoxin reductase component
VIVVVGGGPAGHAAAQAYRAGGGTEAVTLITDDDRPPYNRPPLSKEHLRGEMHAAELLLEPPAWYPEHDVELVHDAVATLDPAARRAVTAGGRELAYAGAVLATGAAPMRPPVDGADLDGVHVLRTAIDSARLQAVTGTATRVVVVGAGFIGCEAAASLARRGADVTLVAPEDVPQGARLGRAAGERIIGWLAEEGVRARMGTAIDAISRDGDTLLVAAGGRTLPADVVLLGAGVEPRDELARAAGLRMGPEGRHVAVDAGMATSAPGLYAAGDVTFAANATAGRPLHVEHWGDALAHGEIAGRRLAGDATAVWDTVPGFWSTIGDRTLKYAAWGDGHDDVELTADVAGFTVWYRKEGRLVGVLTHGHDEDYEAGTERISAQARR